jgi:2-keto-4-pentenoate hydratase/2-oxohepta-3-ene-1,7-dioic acid hydratase in catechol pathway
MKLRLVRYSADGEEKWGMLENDIIYEAVGDVFSGEVSKGSPVGGIEGVRLLPPCGRNAIVSIGANYPSRCRENRLPIPGEPGKGDRFLIPAEALVGPGGLIRLPENEVRVEYSGELGIVIRRTCRNIAIEEAVDCILGYTIVHNVWAKDPPGSQRPVVERIRTYPTFCPVGPCIVTDLDPLSLEWETRVNGEVRQKANTREMLFTPAEIVASVSTWHTLHPGDVIQTGTAAGVGELKPGDIVEIEFAEIGVLRNIAVSGGQMSPLDLVWIG